MIGEGLNGPSFSLIRGIMMAFADIYNIKQRINQIDPRMIRIDWDEKRLLHKIIAWDRFDEEEYVAFTVPHGELDARVERDVYRLNPERYNVMEELRKMAEEKQRREDSKISDMAHDLADNLYDSFCFKPSRSID